MTLVWNWNIIPIASLIAVVKLIEFMSSAVLLRSLSAFQLKAWLGIGIILSYVYEIVFQGEIFRFIKILYLFMILIGLFFIADNMSGINIKKTWGFLFLYISSKFSYGLIIHQCPTIEFSISALIVAFLILSTILVFLIKPKEMLKRNPRGTAIAVSTKVPNAIGLFVESTAAMASLTTYALIQPLILVALFFIDLVQTNLLKNRMKKSGIIGGILTIAGVLCYQLL
jgi:hypothetical protein